MARFEALHRVGHRVGADELAKIEDGCRPAQPGCVRLASRWVDDCEFEIRCHSEQSCTPKDRLSVCVSQGA